MTFDILWQFIIAEFSLGNAKIEALEFEKNDKKNTDQPTSCEEENIALASDTDDGYPVVDVISTVVGWREEEGLFEACLKSYKAARGCRFLIIGVDGDTVEDMAMIDVHERVRYTNFLTNAMPLTWQRSIETRQQSYTSNDHSVNFSNPAT